MATGNVVVTVSADVVPLEAMTGVDRALMFVDAMQHINATRAKAGKGKISFGGPLSEADLEDIADGVAAAMIGTMVKLKVSDPVAVTA